MIVKFKRAHLMSMVLQDKQADSVFTPSILDALENSGEAYTALEGEEVLACAGVIVVSPGRAIAWSYLSQDVGRRMVGVIRGIKRFLDLSNIRRIEMDVDCDFPQAHRMARMLGFEMEAERRRCFSPDGRDFALYARIR